MLKFSFLSQHHNFFTFAAIIDPPYTGYMSLDEEIEKRRTFGIISHPDAGKTTLTEKLLLFGGAIQKAGAVKSSKIKDHARSDWMEIEKQRGISVATSVMGFNYKDVKINLLDTPGHQDFAEDTYRTLTAVDSVILVIDCVKGVEIQTEKLMEVCRMRSTPVICFINKLDREGRDPFELLDEIEEKLKIQVRPLSWPISMGKTFKGVYSLYEKSLHLFTASKATVEEGIEVKDIQDPALDNMVGESNAKQLRLDIELIEGVYPEFDADKYLNGRVAPVFFGSAVNNFGVKELLDTFIRIAPAPIPRETTLRIVEPGENKFTALSLKYMPTWIRNIVTESPSCEFVPASLKGVTIITTFARTRVYVFQMQRPSWLRTVRRLMKRGPAISWVFSIQGISR